MLGRLDLLTTIVPPLALLIVAAAMVVVLAIMGRMVGDAERPGRRRSPDY